MPFVHVATGMPLDVVLAGSGLEEEFLFRAESTDIGGTSVPLIELSDLIVAKVLAGRPKDIGDASGLWRLHSNRIDRGRVRSTLQLLEEALGQSDLVPAFERLARDGPGDVC
jgi:predicted nucleotidyltransferase